MYSLEKKRRPVRKLREVVPREKPQALVERITDSDSEEETKVRRKGEKKGEKNDELEG